MSQTTSFQLFSCEKLPNVKQLQSQTELRNILLQETGGGEAFIQRAIETITQLVIHAAVGKEEPLLAELRRLGYSESDITSALAQAWLEETETFALPKIAQKQKFQKKGGIIFVALIITCLLATIFIFGFRHIFPDLIGTLLAFPPLIALPATIFYVLVYWILKKIWRV